VSFRPGADVLSGRFCIACAAGPISAGSFRATAPSYRIKSYCPGTLGTTEGGHEVERSCAHTRATATAMNMERQYASFHELSEFWYCPRCGYCPTMRSTVLACVARDEPHRRLRT